MINPKVFFILKKMIYIKGEEAWFGAYLVCLRGRRSRVFPKQILSASSLFIVGWDFHIKGHSDFALSLS